MSLVLVCSLLASWAPTVGAQEAVLPIGTVQGAVGDVVDARSARSPYAPPSGSRAGQTVTVQGVVYQRTRSLQAVGRPLHGFLVQNTVVTADGDPATSDGILVSLGEATSLADGYTPRVGDEVVVRARVAESFGQTQLVQAQLVRHIRAGVNLDAEVPAFEADPPNALAEADRYWERREGMRGRVPSGSIVLGGRNVFPGTLDGEVSVARGDSALGRRVDPYARRAFRDPHPLDNVPDQLFDDGNGYRILLGSHGIKASVDDSAALIAPARTFDSLTNALVGGVSYGFGKYAVQVERQPALSPGTDPVFNAPLMPVDRALEYSIATFNVENLYDFRDDPFDGCDFVDNPGCPGVRPPFDYVPASDADYQARLREIAAQIVDDLHGPDVILVQEAEDQDLCASEAAVLTCSLDDNADGKPDTLQELALAIADMGGPAYEAAYDRDGTDDRGIVSAFLYRADRVELPPARADHPVLGLAPRVDYRSAALRSNADVQNPKTLNARLPEDVDRSTSVDGNNVFTRAPQVGLFRVWQDAVGAGSFVDVYLLNNHFSSGPERRVGQRQQQAAYNAAVVAALQAVDPDARILVGGDLNVFPRPDDPFPAGHPRHPSDQLAALYEQGLTNLFDRLAAEVTASAYSYVFQGQAQTLDQMFVSPSMGDELVQVRVAHINSDWPADHAGDGARGVSDHDPWRARFSFPSRLLDTSGE